MDVTESYQWPLNSGPVRFDYTDLVSGTGVAAIQLPPGAVVTGGFLVVETAWDSGTSAVVDIGDSADPDRYVAAQNIMATGLTEVTLTGFEHTNGDEVLITLTEVGAAATAGEAYLVLEVVMDGRVNEAVT